MTMLDDHVASPPSTTPPTSPPVLLPDGYDRLPPPVGPTTPPTPDRRTSRGASPFRRGVLLGAVVGGLVGASVAAGTVLVADDGGGDAGTGTATAPAAVPASAAANTIQELVTSTRPSIVSIHTSVAQTDVFGNSVEGQAAGTGFVLTSDGDILTNDHVVDGATGITVDFSDKTGVPAQVVAADPGSDLAVLHVDRTGLTPLQVGDSDALQVGDQVVAIGNALDLSGEPTVTTGIVSATGRTLTEPNGEHLAGLLQTDTAINPGNSGGPLLDMAGEVVGVNTAIAGQGQNIGFAIAMSPARSVIDQLRKGEVPQHALLGVTTRPAIDNGKPAGAEVVQVGDGTAAANAELRQGDRITKIDDTAISSPDQLGAAIAAHRPGDTVTITYERDGASHTVDAELGTKPASGG